SALGAGGHRYPASRPGSTLRSAPTAARRGSLESPRRAHALRRHPRRAPRPRPRPAGRPPRPPRSAHRPLPRRRTRVSHRLTARSGEDRSEPSGRPLVPALGRLGVELAEDEDAVRGGRVEVVRRLREIEPEIPGAVELFPRHPLEVEVVLAEHLHGQPPGSRGSYGRRRSAISQIRSWASGRSRPPIPAAWISWK